METQDLANVDKTYVKTKSGTEQNMQRVATGGCLLLLVVLGFFYVNSVTDTLSFLPSWARWGVFIAAVLYIGNMIFNYGRFFGGQAQEKEETLEITNRYVKYKNIRVEWQEVGRVVLTIGPIENLTFYKSGGKLAHFVIQYFQNFPDREMILEHIEAIHGEPVERKDPGAKGAAFAQKFIPETPEQPADQTESE